MIKPASVEKRDYQISMVKTALETHTLIVLPTGLGKTTIALLIMAEKLTKTDGKCLFLAPTRVLVHQHFTSLQKFLDNVDISMVTGESDQTKRERAWDNRIVCATPQTALKDLKRGIIKLQDVALIIFDEAHRAIGNYAYCGIANMFNIYKPHIVGMTATIPSDKAKASGIMNNLGIKKVSFRDETSQDVRQYIQQTRVEWIYVELSAVLKQIRSSIVAALEPRIRELVQKCVIKNTKVSRSELIRALHNITRINKGAVKTLYTAIRISHALNILDTQGLTPFLRFFERLEGKGGVAIKELIHDANFKTAYQLAIEAVTAGVEHPKVGKLKEILQGEESKILVFASYRDSVETICNKLRDAGFSTGYLIGKAGKYGLKQKEQIETVNKFRDGRYKILVATQVGEEGLDISECNLVVFYDNVPSAIRFVQRKGRTGRKAPGRVVVLITKDTLDEAYYWISKRKMRESMGMVNKMNRMMQTKKTTLDQFMAL